MRTVFLDTVGLIATWDTRDQWHAQAAPVFQALAQSSTVLVTTELVLAECANAASRKPYRSRVGVLRQHLVDQKRLVAMDETLLAECWHSYTNGKVGDAGLVDQTSFAVMRRLGIVEAFTNDLHFKAAGFTVLF